MIFYDKSVFKFKKSLSPRRQKYTTVYPGMIYVDTRAIVSGTWTAEEIQRHELQYLDDCGYIDYAVDNSMIIDSYQLVPTRDTNVLYVAEMPCGYYDEMVHLKEGDICAANSNHRVEVYCSDMQRGDRIEVDEISMFARDVVSEDDDKCGSYGIADFDGVGLFCYSLITNDGEVVRVYDYTDSYANKIYTGNISYLDEDNQLYYYDGALYSRIDDGL